MSRMFLHIKKVLEIIGNKSMDLEEKIYYEKGCKEDVKRYTRKKNYIIFGRYPQTKVTDPKTISRLTVLAGNIPTSSNSYKWTTYGYYENGSISNYMFYIDIDTNNDNIYDYRGVYFTSYRPYYCFYSSSSSYSHQDDNGYYTSNVYFFKYEPVKWNILKEENSKALIISDLLLDSQQYDYDGLYSNNYQESTIRKWLNDTFYNTCFNSYEKEIIETTNVDNSADSTGYDGNFYACSNTNDKIFLLSYKEATTYYTSNSERQTTASDYAKSQGIYVNSSYNASFWWLRSPYDYYYSNIARGIYYDGGISDYDVGNTSHGVRAACWINL